jgi:cell division protein FtsA
MGNDHLIAGIVITGGGSTLDGMLELSEEVLGMPVRQGLPRGIRGLPEELSHPVYSTVVGLALFGSEEVGNPKKLSGKTNNSQSFLNRILSWAGN